MALQHGKFQGRISSKSTLDLFSNAARGSYWIYDDDDPANIGGVILYKGDQIWCSRSFPGMPTTLNNGHFSVIADKLREKNSTIIDLNSRLLDL